MQQHLLMLRMQEHHLEQQQRELLELPELLQEHPLIILPLHLEHLVLILQMLSAVLNLLRFAVMNQLILILVEGFPMIFMLIMEVQLDQLQIKTSQEIVKQIM